MTFFNPAPSSPPAPPRKKQISRPKNDIDDFLSSDLELSFASTMSLNSPPRSQAPSPIAMDISPALPAPQLQKSHHLAPPAPRLFGRNLLNDSSPGTSNKSTDAKSTSSRGRQRAALPLQWMMNAKSSTNDESSPSAFHMAESFSAPSPGDAMDVDIVSASPSAPAALADPTSPMPTPVVADASYSNLFFGATSPAPHAPVPKKRRSSSPEPNQSTSSSEPLSSPSHHKFTRAATVGAGAPLFKKPIIECNAPSTKRIPARRPALSALVAPSGISGQALSAYPILSGSVPDHGPLTAPLPPPRRSFSAMVSPTAFVEPSSDDFSDVQTSSPAAAYAKRHHARMIRRCDGSDDLRPLHGAGSLGKRDRAEFQQNEKANGCSPKSLAGFGVKEVEKKILPCHRVSDDGLVRITSDTLKGLLDGAYSSQVSNFIIVDCRFEYEYEGGHIPGAINLNTTNAIEDYFLGTNKPTPCESGDPAAKTVLVFHCEFSVKRAPTFAKHVRSKDRAMNGRVYPKVCYPEMYILEGGYSQFFKEYPSHCKPGGYVQMDDPAYTQTRDADLNNFRRGKWLRTQSYTYGQTSSGTSSFPLLSSGTTSATATTSREHRKTAPSGGIGGGGSMFAAANAARGRRAGGLCTLDEDVSSSSHEDNESIELQDSPCPPPSKGASRLSVLGAGKSSRISLDRTVSFGAAGSSAGR
ncbi:hypothetical protein K439DRAFT_1620502 [Ramaria rubella]|nr:hypothetical protein K439DRAFT_1620502 [Ramaria rubella]